MTKQDEAQALNAAYKIKVEAVNKIVETGGDYSTTCYQITRVIKALQAQDTGGEGKHKWDRAGERCVKCGDKDWVGDPKCTPKPERNLEALLEEVLADNVDTTVTIELKKWKKSGDVRTFISGWNTGKNLTGLGKTPLEALQRALDGGEG